MKFRRFSSRQEQRLIGEFDNDIYLPAGLLLLKLPDAVEGKLPLPSFRIRQYAEQPGPAKIVVGMHDLPRPDHRRDGPDKRLPDGHVLSGTQ